MKFRITVLGILAIALLATVAAAAHHPTGDIVIDAAADKQAPVTFPHGTHVEVVDDCTTCHHTSEGLTAESDMKVPKCSECHLNPEGDVPDMAQMSLKKNPLHAGCIDCHKEEAKGPTKCNECHVK